MEVPTLARYRPERVWEIDLVLDRNYRLSSCLRNFRMFGFFRNYNFWESILVNMIRNLFQYTELLSCFLHSVICVLSNLLSISIRIIHNQIIFLPYFFIVILTYLYISLSSNWQNVDTIDWKCWQVFKRAFTINQVPIKPSNCMNETQLEKGGIY